MFSILTYPLTTPTHCFDPYDPYIPTGHPMLISHTWEHAYNLYVCFIVVFFVYFIFFSPEACVHAIICMFLSFFHFVLECVKNSFLLLHVQNMLLLTLFYLWSTCIYLKADMPFPYVHLIFTLCFTCVHLKANTFLYLFKPAVRQLYSLTFHWEFYCSYSEPLNLRQYLAIGNLSVSDLNIGLKLDTWITWLSNKYRLTCSVPNTSIGS